MKWDKEVIFHLRNYQNNKNAIKKLEERLAIKEEMKYTLKAQNNDDIKIQANNDSSDKLLNMIVECEELQKQLRNVRFEIKWLETGMEILNEIESQCLNEFYIKDNPHAALELSRKLNYSNKHIYRIRNNALAKLVANLYGCC